MGCRTLPRRDMLGGEGELGSARVAVGGSPSVHPGLLSEEGGEG